jgi:hypothetical protein
MRVLLTLSCGRLYMTSVQRDEQPRSLLVVQSPTGMIILHIVQAFESNGISPFFFELAARKRAELIEQLTEVHDNC